MCDTVKLHIYLKNHVDAYLLIINRKIFHTHTISDSVALNISISDRQCFRTRLPSNRKPFARS